MLQCVRAFILVLCLALSSGCGVLRIGNDGSVPLLGAGCKVASDQRGGFMARMDAENAVRVTIDSTFSDQQKNDVQLALAVWNSYSNQQLGRSLFAVQRANVNISDTPDEDKDCDFDGSSGDTFTIFRETNEAHWKALKLTSGNPGVTIRCYRGNELIRQTVMINTAYAHKLQLASVVLHEIGHASGLDHSCTGGGSQENYRSCEGLAESHSYRQAVMYPVLRLGNSPMDMPERKENLMLNDMERANCLYKL